MLLQGYTPLHVFRGSPWDNCLENKLNAEWGQTLDKQQTIRSKLCLLCQDLFGLNEITISFPLFLFPIISSKSDLDFFLQKFESKSIISFTIMFSVYLYCNYQLPFDLQLKEIKAEKKHFKTTLSCHSTDSIFGILSDGSK